MCFALRNEQWGFIRSWMHLTWGHLLLDPCLLSSNEETLIHLPGLHCSAGSWIWWKFQTSCVRQFCSTFSGASTKFCLEILRCPLNSMGRIARKLKRSKTKSKQLLKKTRPDYFLSLQKVPAKQDSSNKLQDSSNKLLHGVFPTFPPSNNP